MQTRKLWVCVVEIAGMKRLYIGRSLALAAVRLEPGTCYGYGHNQQEALSAGMLEAAVFRMGTSLQVTHG